MMREGGAVHHENRGLSVVEDVGDFIAREPEVDRLPHETPEEADESGDDQLHPVGRDHRHAVARDGAPPLQLRREGATLAQ